MLGRANRIDGVSAFIFYTKEEKLFIVWGHKHNSYTSFKVQCYENYSTDRLCIEQVLRNHSLQIQPDPFEISALDLLACSGAGEWVTIKYLI